MQSSSLFDSNCSDKFFEPILSSFYFNQSKLGAMWRRTRATYADWISISKLLEPLLITANVP
jgi:hypothetical protein